MKGIFFTAVFVLSLIVLSGCYTIPRHYNSNTQEIIIIYDPGPPPPPDYYPPVPPSPPVYYPQAPEQTNPPRNRQPEKPQDSYQQRDPLQGNNNRGGIDPKPVPPIRIAEQKDRGHE